MNKLTGPQIGQLRDLLAEAFSREDFRQLVRIKLEIRFDTEYNSSGLPFKDVLFEFIEDMERKGRTAQLIEVVLKAREKRADFKLALEAILTILASSSGKVASDCPEPPALKIWKEKLEYLRVQEAIVASAAERFQIEKEIEKALRKIREYGVNA